MIRGCDGSFAQCHGAYSCLRQLVIDTDERVSACSYIPVWRRNGKSCFTCELCEEPRDGIFVCALASPIARIRAGAASPESFAIDAPDRGCQNHRRIEGKFVGDLEAARKILDEFLDYRKQVCQRLSALLPEGLPVAYKDSRMVSEIWGTILYCPREADLFGIRVLNDYGKKDAFVSTILLRPVGID